MQCYLLARGGQFVAEALRYVVLRGEGLLEPRPQVGAGAAATAAAAAQQLAAAAPRVCMRAAGALPARLRAPALSSSSLMKAERVEISIVLLTRAMRSFQQSHSKCKASARLHCCQEMWRVL